MQNTSKHIGIWNKLHLKCNNSSVEEAACSGSGSRSSSCFCDWKITDHHRLRFSKSSRATCGLPYIYLIQKITQNYLWQRGKGLNQIVCNFDSTFAVRLWQNQLENSVTKRSRIRHQLDCLNKNSQTLWCDTSCNRKRHFLSHQNFNCIYLTPSDGPVAK